jgi:hypothetical protein
MRKAMSIAALLVVYLALSVLTGDQFIISKSLPPIIAVLAAWLIDRQISAVSIVASLVVAAVLLPLSFLVFALPVADSLTDNIQVLIHNLTLSDVIQLFLPVAIGGACAIAILAASVRTRRQGDPKQQTGTE